MSSGLLSTAVFYFTKPIKSLMIRVNNNFYTVNICMEILKCPNDGKCFFLGNYPVLFRRRKPFRGIGNCFSSPLASCCAKTAPIPISLASVYSTNCPCVVGNAKMGAVINSAFNVQNADSHSLFQTEVYVFL